jgi:hypothetical protein
LKNSAAEPEQEKKPKSAKEKYSEKKSKEDEKKAAPEVRRRFPDNALPKREKRRLEITRPAGTL